MLPKIEAALLRHARCHRMLSTKQRVFVEVYGCQMNSNDAEIVHGILDQSGKYEKCGSVEQADVVLLMTCAIRENAENKVWSRLQSLRGYEKTSRRPLTVGVLGCMAERLKTDLLERSKTVDLVCGPDAYRDLPTLLARAGTDRDANINVSLSVDETYADIKPVRLDDSKKSAYISIMRGCNNMCAFCIVPFVRGRERSRPADSIADEVRHLIDHGVREITLLGQNVNSYCDETLTPSDPAPEATSNAVPGFTSVFKTIKQGVRFVGLLEHLSALAPEIRFRFTSPHPKDFPEPLLHLIRERPNICKQIHLPAQSGSSAVLERMRRGYTREAYMELVGRIRSIIPQVTLSSDFISGFVGETETDHEQTLELIRDVRYDMAYMYAYSMREKTMAHRRYVDDVPEETKQRRLREVIDCFHQQLKENSGRFVGTRQLVLIDGPSKKDPNKLQGRTDGNKPVILDGASGDYVAGDYVQVDIAGLANTSLLGRPVKKSSIGEFHQSTSFVTDSAAPSFYPAASCTASNAARHRDC